MELLYYLTLDIRQIYVVFDISEYDSFLYLQFGEMGGFTAIQCKLNQEEIEIGVRLYTFQNVPDIE